MGKFNYKEDDFEEVKTKAEEFYNTLTAVRCPYFLGDVTFNAKGIRHLKFKSEQVARTSKDQYARLKLLPLAPEVLKKSHTLQGIWVTKVLETEKINSRWDRVLRDVTFYEFMAVLEDVRLKVIVKEVGAERYFWSVIPFWAIDKDASKRLLYKRQSSF